MKSPEDPAHPDQEPETVLFLCVGNSCRSQMAEGLVNHLLSPGLRAFSAGTHPARSVHAGAIATLKEIGIDISRHQPKSVEVFHNRSFDYTITLCHEAREICPVFPGARIQHHFNLADPAGAGGTQEEVWKVTRQVRDEIMESVIPWIRDNLEGKD